MTTPPTPERSNHVLLSRSTIERAASTIASLIRHTPVLTVPGTTLGVEPMVTFKLEFLQNSGTFKGRGASNFIATSSIPSSGVVAASGGNHGAAVAWAAQKAGHRATIFVPTISSPAKVERLHRYGADVHQIGAVYGETLAAAEEFAAQSGAVPIHAYNDPTVMSGAGTVARELDEQAPDLDAVLVACGGGGLAGGMATWIGDTARLIVCETNDTRAFAAAREAGEPVDVEVSGIAADALGATKLGSNPWLALQAAESALVTDAETKAAQGLLWDEFRVIVEPAAAVPLAALRSGRIDLDGVSSVGIVLCGANLAITY